LENAAGSTKVVGLISREDIKCSCSAGKCALIGHNVIKKYIESKTSVFSIT